jgi:DNA-binding protein HU-beta
MTKTQLIAKLADQTELSKKQVESVLTSLVETIRKSVKKSDPVKIPDLGGWRLRSMKARMGRNPQSGEPIKIPARKKVGFTVAKSFKESVLGAKR